jgi:hypothetical protein
MDEKTKAAITEAFIQEFLRERPDVPGSREAVEAELRAWGFDPAFDLPPKAQALLRARICARNERL